MSEIARRAVLRLMGGGALALVLGKSAEAKGKPPSKRAPYPIDYTVGYS